MRGPRVSLRLPWAMCYIGLSARPCKIRNFSKLILKTYLTSKLQIFIAKEEEGEEVEIGLRLKHYRPSLRHFVTLLHHFVTLLLLSYHLL